MFSVLNFNLNFTGHKKSIKQRFFSFRSSILPTIKRESKTHKEPIKK